MEANAASPTVVDARGLPCPDPVILALETIKMLKTADPGTRIEVLVTTTKSRNNVALAGQQQGWDWEYAQDADGVYHVTLTK